MGPSPPVKFLLVPPLLKILGTRRAGKQMTVPMSLQETIRTLDSQGVSGREIARRVGVSRTSVAKYLALTDYSPQPPAPGKRPGGSVLAGLTDVIDRWLIEDQGRPVKQQHTAKRIADRLVDEYGYTGAYPAVQRYVKAWKAENRKDSEGYTELSWQPGVIQVDFGQAQAIIAGMKMVLHMLVVTFPASNMRYVQAFRGETAECVCAGLRTVFEHVGAVPRLMIFDNATGIGRRVGTKVVESKLFAAFKLHYRSQSRYCNPYSGHEKGSVENAVGFLRRNLMVPLPVADSLAELNERLLNQCDKLGQTPHYRQGRSINDLFKEDLQACLELPGIGFDPVRYESRKADRTGNIQIDANTYAAGPAFYGRTLTVAIRHDVIEILDEHAHPIRVFPRAFGTHPDTIFDPASLVPHLIAKPGAWTQSQLRPLVSDPVRDWLDQASAIDRRRLFTAVDNATEPTNFTTAIQAADILISAGDDPDTGMLSMLARRLAQGSEPAAMDVDLTIYDTLTTRPTTPNTNNNGNDRQDPSTNSADSGSDSGDGSESTSGTGLVDLQDVEGVVA